ncbi:hypothetical protein BYT27DRAFT_7201146 [Phlegmacium glaucopus]|nr:hypothetical protein BYT27DRAFT_7201146 [Phlegmacium glaucopus]
MPENDPQPEADSPLTTWVKVHLGSFYHDESATGEATDFQTAFNSTFSDKVSLRINHQPTSRDDFESEMRASQSALSRSSTIDWKEMLEIPTNSEEGAISGPGGIVAGFFVVTRSMKWKIRASAAQTLSYNSFSARISQEGGQTRITELLLTFHVQAAPIHLHGIPTRS